MGRGADGNEWGCIDAVGSYRQAAATVSPPLQRKAAEALVLPSLSLSPPLPFAAVCADSSLSPLHRILFLLRSMRISHSGCLAAVLFLSVPPFNPPPPAPAFSFFQCGGKIKAPGKRANMYLRLSSSWAGASFACGLRCILCVLCFYISIYICLHCGCGVLAIVFFHDLLFLSLSGGALLLFSANRVGSFWSPTKINTPYQRFL